MPGMADDDTGEHADRTHPAHELPATVPRLDELHIRRALGEFATGVSLVTTSDGNGPAGFACQSFSSLSLDPPLVLFTVMRTSRTWPRIAEAGRFAVNVLAEEQRPLSEAFGRRGADKFAHGTWAASPLGNPVLHGCVIWIDCELIAVHDGGDHHIAVGRIRDLGHREKAKPLVYHRGSYAGLAAAGRDAPADQLSRQRPSV